MGNSKFDGGDQTFIIYLFIGRLWLHLYENIFNYFLDFWLDELIQSIKKHLNQTLQKQNVEILNYYV